MPEEDPRSHENQLSEDPKPAAKTSEPPTESWQKRLRGREIRQAIDEALATGRWAYHPHCKSECAKDGIAYREVWETLKFGQMAPAPNEFDGNPRWNRVSKPPEWSYTLRHKIRDRWIHVAVRFRDDKGQIFALCYTC